MIQVLSSAMPITFDGRESQCFMLTLRNNVSGARVRYITPGVLYTFIIYQDQFGHHSFVWPAEFIEPQRVDTNPFSATTQTFIGTADNKLHPIVAGAWTERAA